MYKYLIFLPTILAFDPKGTYEGTYTHTKYRVPVATIKANVKLNPDSRKATINLHIKPPFMDGKKVNTADLKGKGSLTPEDDGLDMTYKYNSKSKTLSMPGVAGRLKKFGVSDLQINVDETKNTIDLKAKIKYSIVNTSVDIKLHYKAPGTVCNSDPEAGVVHEIMQPESEDKEKMVSWGVLENKVRSQLLLKMGINDAVKIRGSCNQNYPGKASVVCRLVEDNTALKYQLDASGCEDLFPLDHGEAAKTYRSGVEKDKCVPTSGNVEFTCDETFICNEAGTQDADTTNDTSICVNPAHVVADRTRAADPKLICISDAGAFECIAGHTCRRIGGDVKADVCVVPCKALHATPSVTTLCTDTFGLVCQMVQNPTATSTDDGACQDEDESPSSQTSHALKQKSTSQLTLDKSII